MNRLLAPVSAQASVHALRNRICRLQDPITMAKTSVHLRNQAVGGIIGYIGMLDGHKRIVGRSAIQAGPAQFQQACGTTENPFSHVLPSNILLNGNRLLDFYRSHAPRTHLQLLFGMGIMAPEDWAKAGRFSSTPRQQNIVDSSLERYQRGDGLVTAFEACGAAAVRQGLWNGSGKRRHTLGSLTNLIAGIYTSIWAPIARTVYVGEQSRVALKLHDRRKLNPLQVKDLEVRQDILNAQVETFEQDKMIADEIAVVVWKSALAESWE